MAAENPATTDDKTKKMDGENSTHTQVSDKRTSWWQWGILGSLVIIMLGVIAGLMLVIFGVPGRIDALEAGEIQVGMVVLLATSAMLVLMSIAAIVYYMLGLADPKQALGLPEGSIRALIALFLIMIFIIMSLYLFRITATEKVNDGAQQLALQLVTVLGTLVTAVSAFYFGSATAISAANKGAGDKAPKGKPGGGQGSSGEPGGGQLSSGEGGATAGSE